MEALILFSIYGFTILGGVYLGYRITITSLDLDLKYEPIEDDWKVEPKDIPDNFIEKIFGKKLEDEKEILRTEDLEDKRKTHAFYD